MNKPLITACLALSFTIVACGGDPVGRSGSPAAEPTSLRSVWGQDATGVGGDVLGQLIRDTDGAAVTVTEAAKPQVGNINQEYDAVKALQSGDADLTVVRAGVVEKAGVSSLAPLGAPFVVTNNDQADAIAADDKLVEQLFAGLDDAGLVGVALVPGGLRHPFGYGDEPLLGAEDYQGQNVNVRPNDPGVLAILGALGGRANYSVDAERHQLATSGQLRGIEVSMQQFGAVTLPAVQTANVTLYEKFDIVLMAKSAWDGLSRPQREELRASVRMAIDEARSSRPTEESGQHQWCQQTGAATVLATDAELTSLHAVLDPVTESFELGAAADVIARMRELGTGTLNVDPEACQGPRPPSTTDYVVEPKGDQGVLNGTWRLVNTEQMFLDAGISAGDARANAGVWEFRLKDGYMDIEQGNGQPCNGAYAIDGHDVSLELGVDGMDACGGTMKGTWRIDDGRLFFDWQKELEYDVLLDQVQFSPGMVKVE